MTEIQRASEQLVDLAVAVRPDWPADSVRGALVAAANAGTSWPQALVQLARLMVDPRSRPGDLVPATPGPHRHDPDVARRGRQRVEQALRDAK